jgi:peptidoglycan/LPS O-acetylase OafA/YrhL
MPCERRNQPLLLSTTRRKGRETPIKPSVAIRMIDPADSSKLEHARERSALGYMPQLDGLRALAVIAVWLEHWGYPPIRASRYLAEIHPGAMGVWLFFVLSGFLITRILLQSRTEIGRPGGTTLHAAKIFYARRFLRILPVYYLTLFVASLLLPEVRHVFWWHFTYNTNCWAVFHPHEYPAGTHFWSLAVEEQFYLIWPWVMLLVPSRYLLRTIIGVIAIGLVFRFGCTLLPRGHRGTPAYALLPACADKLGFGALLAFFWDANSDGKIARWKHLLLRSGLLLGLPGVIAMITLRAYRPESRLALIFLSFFAAFFFTWLIGRAARGFGGPVGVALESHPIRYLGKISYGLYLFHYLVPQTLARLHVPEPHSWTIKFAFFSAVTIAIASVSWYAFEKPINGLKRFFAYSKRPGSFAIAAITEPLGAVTPARGG